MALNHSIPKPHTWLVVLDPWCLGWGVVKIKGFAFPWGCTAGLSEESGPGPKLGKVVVVTQRQLSGAWLGSSSLGVHIRYLDLAQILDLGSNPASPPHEYALW